MIGLVGKKIGMTCIFTEDNIVIPVTVIKVEINQVIQIRNLNHSGRYSVQITTGRKKNNRMTKPEAGHFLKNGIEAGCGLWEFSFTEKEMFSIGQRIGVKFFSNIKKVDITGISKGKGFSGTIKRWNFHIQDATHGNSLSHRVPGSIGQNQTPGKVFKGKKMAGRLGGERITVQNLSIIRIDILHNLLLVKGAVPGVNGSNLVIKPATKGKH